MLCARQCPDWCIYIEGHKEKRPPRREGGRDRTVSVLDRFDIDYALCMYCGICVEVCPFDALVLEPRVRVLRVEHRQAAARQEEARRVDGDRPRARAARDRRRGEEVDARCRTSPSGSCAVAMAFAAIGVVRSQNVVHAALYLVVVLAGAAAQYILVAAEFVAWVQVLIYIGAIVILFLFGIMLTRAPMRSDSTLDNNATARVGCRLAVPVRRAHRAPRRRVRRRGDRARRQAPRRRQHRAPSVRACSATTSCPSRSCRCCSSPRSSAPS